MSMKGLISPMSGTRPRVLLLSPSGGLGGGIERYVETLQWAFGEQGVACARADLEQPGLAGHWRLLRRLDLLR